jgi:hypothetical protein
LFLNRAKDGSDMRSIPLPQVVLDALAAHLGALLPLSDWVRVRHRRRQSHPSHRIRGCVASCVKAAGAPAGRAFFMSCGTYASLLLRRGESVKTVQA